MNNILMLARSESNNVRAVLHGKKLLLLDRIAKSLEWPDKHLHRDLCAGFKLSGVPDPTGVFEADHKPALASEEQFWDAAEVLRVNSGLGSGISRPRNTMMRSLRSLLGRPVFLAVRVGWRVLSLLINFRSASMGSGCLADVSLFGRTSGDRLTILANRG